MPYRSPVAVIVSWVFVVGLVLGLSLLASGVRRGEAEAERSGGMGGALTGGTTVAEIAERSGLPDPMLRDALGLRGPEDRERTLSELGLTPEEAKERIQRAMALGREGETKSWRKIVAKFGAWGMFLGVVFVLMRRSRLSPSVRLGALAVAVAVFGIAFGPEQSPKGTVKDTIALWGRSGVLFPPRLIALALFLAMAIAGNKFICGWGCQFGALQDLVFRLNRDRHDRKGVLRQLKPSFAVSNAVRVAFFAVFTAVAVGWATDIIEPVDPFKIYSPKALGAVGLVFVGAVLAAGLFVYRPWCHFFCPFGLVGWVAEKVSINRIRVNYDTCVACEQCARACPSTVMGAILKQDRVIPDCFACGVCVETCPTKSISFDREKRAPVPEGKFAEAPRAAAVPEGAEQVDQQGTP